MVMTICKRMREMRISTSVAYIIQLSLIMAFAVIMSSCGGSGSRSADTLTVTQDTVPTPEPEVVLEARLSPRGIDPVKIGMRITEISPKVENLYDSIVHESGYESDSYSFLLDGKQRFTVYEFESGAVDVLAVDDGSVFVSTPDGGSVRLGDDFSKVLAIKGVQPVWESADGDGMWCWTWQGIWFQPDQSNLPDVLSHKLYNPSSAPAASDFNSEVKVGYMGTGLPW